ncbi:MAG: L-aspartate oxidase [Candidatus Delongbacteria bacterium]|nr:L-aspartate oxidase [Candidatus Delongbacteria bacterium]MBN2834459.1 L-aspartate oxidase [Candidatus Delongbacteria bacterium]
MKKHYDFLVIGSGIAGLFYSIKASENGSVLLLTKTDLESSNTYYAQGGIATVEDEEDKFEYHITDTLDAGGDLCYEAAVSKIVHEGPEVINELISLGVEFTKDGEHYSLHREGGHSFNRIFHSKDITGKELIRALINQVKNNPAIEIRSNVMAVDLLTEHQMKSKVKPKNPTCYGAYVLDCNTGEVETILAKSTILATGGSGQVYLYTSNPEVATGDGLAMAYRARATISNLEFFQFHPTTLFTPRNSGKSFLISEAVRGFGGILKNGQGEEFMDKYHKLKSLAPRDVVARAIDTEMKKHGDDFVYLDVTHFPARKIIDSFPNIYKKCLDKGFDITKDMIPVVPAAHYQCGGIETDLNGKTDINGLYAIGEVACTGVHGANRLASNSLLEALVFAKAAAQNSKDYIQDFNVSHFDKIRDWDHGEAVKPTERVIMTYQKNSIKYLMSVFVGIVRTDERLELATTRIDQITRQVRDFYNKTRLSRELLELRNLAETASLIVRCAKFRKESRGLHYNIDYPQVDNANWRINSRIKSNGKLTRGVALS